LKTEVKLLSTRCFLIINPTSGSFSRKKLERIVGALEIGGVEPTLLATTSAMDPTLFATRICGESENPLILVAGGDGTLNGVLNGLTPGAATIGIIPMGTSNVLARELNIKSIPDALRRVVRGNAKPMSVGELQGAGQKKRFLLMAGVGVDGAVVEGVRLQEKKMVGKGAYVLSALRLLRSWDKSHFKVTGNGNSATCHSVIVCNASKYGGNFVLSPEGDIFTPGFQVVCIKGGRRQYFKLCLELAIGRHTSNPAVTIFTAREVEISGAKPVQLDGDFFGHAPLKLTSVPDFVKVII
jgi:diacylglycerol kinase (ATP)